MNAQLVVLATLTGAVTGAFFRFLQIPVPAPPTVSGVMGIVGIFLGYAVVRELGWGFDLLGALGF